MRVIVGRLQVAHMHTKAPSIRKEMCTSSIDIVDRTCLSAVFVFFFFFVFNIQTEPLANSLEKESRHGFLNRSFSPPSFFFHDQGTANPGVGIADELIPVLHKALHTD